MILRLQSNKAKVDLEESKRQSDDASGRIYEIAGDPPRIAKVLPPYPPSAPQDEISQKLPALLLLRDAMWKVDDNRPYLLWPRDLLIDDDGRPRGYVTARLRGAGLEADVRRLYDIDVRRAELRTLDYRTLVKIASNLCGIVAAVHRNGFSGGPEGEHRVVIVNLTERRLRVFPDDGFVSFADPDLMQVSNIQTNTRFRAPDPSGEYLDPDGVGRLQGLRIFEVTTDQFALGITLFKLLMELAHPFTGLVENAPSDAAAAINAGTSPYFGKGATADPDQLGLGDLASELELLFRECLSSERGLYDPAKRPSASRWAAALETALAEMKQCPKNPRHHYFAGGPDKCPWCRLFERTGVDAFPALALPLVTTITPQTLPVRGGEVVIRGEHLSPVKSVSFGEEVVRNWSRATNSEIELEAPAGTGKVDVVVETEAGRSNALTLKYKAPPRPKIDGISPALLPRDGGRVTVEGQYFDGSDEGTSTKVFVGQQSVRIAERGETQLVIDVPRGDGVVEIKIETSDGTATLTATYAPKPPIPWGKIVAAAVVVFGVIIMLATVPNTGCCVVVPRDAGVDADRPDSTPIPTPVTCPKLACTSIPPPTEYQSSLKQYGTLPNGLDIWWCGRAKSAEERWVCENPCVSKMEYCYLSRYYASSCRNENMSEFEKCVEARKAWGDARKAASGGGNTATQADVDDLAKALETAAKALAFKVKVTPPHP